ncbi:Hsp20 family protein [Pseudohongiella spirulinae]|uniref:Heat-shock protein n=1 Tax=Pseudohongiella spirulinae TaxID=1249552 RepID=A0A0S2KCC2_9GAMM|nr:Hsp20 family protein [Pseudohongiella spirulinae]ALO45981.1 Heat-shock protein [Pseudohongiella spirulinae]
MRNIDFAPLYRSAVGFDHLSQLLDAVTQREQNQPSYPPYNIERLDKDQYRITMAVAGFTQDELIIESELQSLKVRGEKAAEQAERQYLHQGIAARNFERVFQLADHIRVVSANLENGLLHIELQRQIPEAMKPRQIPIGASSEKLIEAR